VAGRPAGQGAVDLRVNPAMDPPPPPPLSLGLTPTRAQVKIEHGTKSERTAHRVHARFFCFSDERTEFKHGTTLGRMLRSSTMSFLVFFSFMLPDYPPPPPPPSLAFVSRLQLESARRRVGVGGRAACRPGGCSASLLKASFRVMGYHVHPRLFPSH